MFHNSIALRDVFQVIFDVKVFFIKIYNDVVRLNLILLIIIITFLKNFLIVILK